MDDSSSDQSVDEYQSNEQTNLSYVVSLHSDNNNSSIHQMDIETIVNNNTDGMKSVLASYPEFLNQKDWPPAKHVEEYLEYPTCVKPKSDHVNSLYSEDDTILTHVIRLQNIKAVIGLLIAGADPNLTNRKGVTPISVAAHKGNIEIMLGLIEFGANVNSLNSSGSTALIQASHFGNIDAVRLLLKHHATADFANLKGTTALMRASQEGHVEISRLLIENTADVNRKNHEGMNALMLASQRGHADMVLLLIKAGAAMDEQTSQGSTALMLACKRGHEKCVEVLVTMGAEIYIRDCRNRTAKDTATRRNHIGLLYWLDTQVQVNRMQEYRRRQRTYQLLEMRNAFQKNQLQLHPTEAQLVNVLESFQNQVSSNNSTQSRSRTTSGTSVSPIPSAIAVTTLGRNISMTSSLSSEVFPEPKVAWRESTDGFINMTNRSDSTKNQVWPSSLKKRLPDYQDWQWSKLLFRCMALPDGIYDLIVDYMPLPRIWQWSLWRLRKRCKLAPHISILDASRIMDDILCDSNIFKSKDQMKLLVRINQDPSIHNYLIERWDMTPTLLGSLIQWADVQSLASRVTDTEVIFKAKLARSMLSTAISLYKWYRNKTTSIKALENLMATQPSLAKASLPNVDTMEETQVDAEDENDLLEATDIGGEEGSDGDNLNHEMENEMAVDGDEGRFDDDYADLEGDPAELNSGQMLAMPPFTFPGLG